MARPPDIIIDEKMTPPDTTDDMFGKLESMVLTCLDCRAKLGLIIREHREREGMSAREFSKILNVSMEGLYNLENGTRPPNDEYLNRLAMYVIMARQGKLPIFDQISRPKGKPKPLESKSLAMIACDNE